MALGRACPPGGPWAAPLWGTGTGSPCWSLCPPEEEATALRPGFQPPTPRLMGKTPQLLPQTQLRASSAPTLPSQGGTQGPECQALFLHDTCGASGSIFSPQTSSHEQQRYLKHDGLDFTPSRLMCHTHFVKATRKASTAPAKTCPCFLGIMEAISKSHFLN